MKAIELAKWLDYFHGSDSQFPSKAAQDAAAELRRLAGVNAELLGAMEKIRMRATSDEQVEELEDCQRDLRHIFAAAESAIAKAKEQQ